MHKACSFPVFIFSSCRVTTVVIETKMTTDRFVANVMRLLKLHVVPMFHAHLAFVPAMTQALCYHSWISDDRMEAQGNSETCRSSPHHSPLPSWRVEEPGLSETVPGA